MRLKSPWGGKTDAEDEPLAFRSGVFVFVVRFSGAGCGYQADGSGPAALWDLHVRVFSAGAVRAGVADVPGARIARRERTYGSEETRGRLSARFQNLVAQAFLPVWFSLAWEPKHRQECL